MMTQKIKQLAEKIFNLPSHSQKQLEKILADAFEGCYTREEMIQFSLNVDTDQSEEDIKTDFDNFIKEHRKEKK